MRPVIDTRFATRLALAACVGLAVGALAWMMIPAGTEIDARPGNPARPPPAQTARYGELLIAPLTFAGSDVMVQPTLAGSPVVNTGAAGGVRLLGVSRSARGGRALMALPDGKSVWIRQGGCIDGLCIRAVGRSSVILETGGQSRRVDLFDQMQSGDLGAAPTMSPAQAQPPPAPTPGPQPGGVEPKSAPPGTMPPN